MRERRLKILTRINNERTGEGIKMKDENELTRSLQQLQLAKRELLPPIIRVQKALHPWVAYAVMPLFALANAGVNMTGGAFSADTALPIAAGIILALVIGKPLGIVGMCWISIRLRWCQLPLDVTWKGIFLVGLLAGIGFTMSIFIAMLAFHDESLLNAAKLGVLIGSFTAASLGLIWGYIYTKQLKKN